MKITHCQYNKPPAYYDLTKNESERDISTEEAEARYQAYETRLMLEKLHDDVLALDALIVGMMMSEGSER